MATSATLKNGLVAVAIVLILFTATTTVHGATTKDISPPAADVTASAVPVTASSAATPKATTPKSSISDANLDAALADNRYLTRQLKCALGEAPCDPVGKRLKSLAPFVLRGACPKCTPAEKTQIQKTLAHIQRNFPKEWGRLVQTYAG